MPEENGQPSLTIGRKLIDILNDYREDDPNELLKYRYLCREGILGLYGKTGIGKSSFLMQCLLLWALGREAFGIIPRMAIKSLLIQAENDDGDIGEMCKGVCEGLGLTPEETILACDNIIVIHEDSKYGSDFITSVVSPALEKYKPDLLSIDCALSYLGGDVISQEVVSKFLRNDLKPLLKQYQCGCVMVHHTNKAGSSDDAYAGSGSAEWANTPRAVLVLLPAGKDTFKLIAAKRGTRLHWKMPNGITQTLEKRLKHSSIEGQIFWGEASDDDNVQESDKQQSLESEILQRLPHEGKIHQDELVSKVNTETQIGLNPIKAAIQRMIKNKQIYVLEQPRQNARAKIFYSRFPNEKLERGLQLLEEIDKQKQTMAKSS